MGRHIEVFPEMLAAERSSAARLADRIHGIRQGGQQRGAVLVFARCVQCTQSARIRNLRRRCLDGADRFCS